MSFDPCTVVLSTDSSGNQVVRPVTVRWKGPQRFSLAASDPMSGGACVIPPGRPFSLGACTQEVGTPFQVAQLRFSAAAIATWRDTFNAGCKIVLLMTVDGLGAKQLSVNLVSELRAAIAVSPT